MKLSEALAGAERSRPGILTQAEKISVISSLDKLVCAEVFEKHQNSPIRTFTGYDINSSGESVLLIPDVYAEIYLRRLEAECDYRSGEIERYNNSCALYNSLWEGFVSYWKSKNRPIGAERWKLA